MLWLGAFLCICCVVHSKERYRRGSNDLSNVADSSQGYNCENLLKSSSMYRGFQRPVKYRDKIDPLGRQRLLLGFLSTSIMNLAGSKKPRTTPLPLNLTAQATKEDSLSGDSDGSHTQSGQSLLQKAGQLYDAKFQELPHNSQGHRIAGAVPYAIEKINDEGMINNYYLDFIYNNTEGRQLRSVQCVMDQWDMGVAAYIGPEDTCQVEATIAAAQNLPMISYKCLDSEVSNKAQYPTFTRTRPTSKQISKAAIALLKNFKWKQFTMVYGRSSVYQQIHQAVKDDALQHGLTVQAEPSFEEPYIAHLEGHRQRIKQIVLETYRRTRIYVFVGHHQAVQHMLYTMDDLDLLRGGEYAVIYLDPDYYFKHAEDAAENYFFKPNGKPLAEFFSDEKLYRMLDITHNFLAIISTPLQHTKSSSAFHDKVIAYSQRPPFNFKFGKDTKPLSDGPIIGPVISYVPEESPFAAYLYDAVMLYARAVKIVLGCGGDPFDGKAISSVMRNHTYISIAGFSMRINGQGDVEGNYTLLSRQKNTGNLKDTFHHVMAPTGVFADAGDLPRLIMTQYMDVHWVDEKAPTDEPECGFTNEKCPKKYTIEITFGVVFAVIVLVIAIGIIVYRNWKYEQELAGLIWRIDPSELKMCQNSTLSVVPFLSATSKTSLISQESKFDELNSPGREMFDMPGAAGGGVGVYRGCYVAVKEIRYARRMREISRATKIEMKNMRNFHCDNVNRFLGVIILQQSCIYVVREYCSKGSLFDVLLNKDIKLEALFIASFVEDLLKGLLYLHEQDLRMHGNLKSPNCVVTSRWTLQVADYGLHELRDGQKFATDEVRYWNSLWMAPELLRAGGVDRTCKGTPKADVYSFGIILHEIMARRGPFDMLRTRQSAKEVVTKVLVSTGDMNLLYRPRLDGIECQDYVITTMTQCWADAPDRRPDLRQVRHSLRALSKGMLKRNLMDHMITMMEQYQYNLEDLVEQRTKELEEEKRKTELLLHRMLPPTVATQLILGGTVEPESFDSVTIYFSDIVGFTSLSAESTPMEVVTMLNALYSMFDRIIKKYNVYKVETIGDAYMVVSGLPQRCNDNAGQIATMALHLLEEVKTSFRIPHRPDQQLQLRIGIHTGSCVAGVVGNTMPRYCLFGDTVNTASRMESNGLPLQIHCSEATKLALDVLGGYELVERGVIPMKGKGDMRTFWLEGKLNPPTLTPPDERPTSPNAVELFRPSGMSALPQPNCSVRPRPGFRPLGQLSSYTSIQKIRRDSSVRIKSLKNAPYFHSQMSHDVPMRDYSSDVSEPNNAPSGASKLSNSRLGLVEMRKKKAGNIKRNRASDVPIICLTPPNAKLNSPRNRKRSMSFPDSTQVAQALIGALASSPQTTPSPATKPKKFTLPLMPHDMVPNHLRAEMYRNARHDSIPEVETPREAPVDTLVSSVGWQMGVPSSVESLNESGTQHLSKLIDPLATMHQVTRKRSLSCGDAEQLDILSGGHTPVANGFAHVMMNGKVAPAVSLDFTDGTVHPASLGWQTEEMVSPRTDGGLGAEDSEVDAPLLPNGELKKRKSGSIPPQNIWRNSVNDGKLNGVDVALQPARGSFGRLLKYFRKPVVQQDEPKADVVTAV